MARHAFAALAATTLSASAFATITPSTLFGDSYIVKDGAGASARFYSVLDVYIKGSSSADIVSSTFGVAAYTSDFVMNQGNAFVQSPSLGTNNSWLPAAGNAAWDSFVTCGNRDQTSASTTLGMQLDTNWGAGNGSAISAAAGTGGAGWYPSVGASTSTNPYAKVGNYNGQTGSINTAKAATTITGNGITAGQSLDNLWMIGRFVIDVTQASPTVPVAGPKTMTLKFAIAGKQNGTTTFTGATASAGRFNYTLNFAVPAPGAAALVGMAGLLVRRRARA